MVNLRQQPSYTFTLTAAQAATGLIGRFFLQVSAQAPPAITSLSPASGAAGSTLVINGTNLSGTTAIIFAGSTSNKVTAGFTVNAAGTQLTGVVVPTGATTGLVMVTTPGGTSNGLTFTVMVTPLVLTSTSPVANARAATATGPVSATFNQVIASGSTSALKVFSAQRGGLRSGNSGTITVSGSTVSFAPTFAFKPGETVFSTVTTAATNGSTALAAPFVFQFTAATTPGPGTFGSKTDYTTGKYPNAVALGDVNGDGLLDIVTVNDGGTASVLLGLSAGSYGPKADYPTGSYPDGIALGDVNGDGRLDLVTSNSGDNTISVLLGTGTGTFGLKADYATGAQAYGLALGDVNGDGRLDVVTANINSSSASVLLALNGGGFGVPAIYGTNYSPLSVALGDVNGDGQLDMVTANAISPTHGVCAASVLLGTGAGTFGSKTDYPIASSVISVILGDVNGDGHLDLATANTGPNGGNSTSVLMGTGMGTFGSKTDYPTGSIPYSIALGDVDGDGRLDIVTANFGANTTSVLRGLSAGGFAPKVDYATGINPGSITLGDVNGDGRLDIAAANSGSGNGNTVSVLLAQTGALATANALTAAQVALYPNPAHARFTVLMPGVPGAPAVQAELFNSLGQMVRRQAAALPTSGTTLTVETAGLAAGIYTLRLQAGPTTLAKRVVVQ